MYWAGVYDGYYATVDDDIFYPSNYIECLKRKVDTYGQTAICSYHGHIYNNVVGGRIRFPDRKVLPFGIDCQKDVVCHRVGMGVAMCCPKKIGLDRNLFLSRPKNFGDDEIAAIWAQQSKIPMIRVANEGVRLVENIKLSRNGGLCVDENSMERRSRFLESYCGWKLNYPTVVSSTADSDADPFFRIIIPTYNSERFLSRCVQSVLNQTFRDYHIIIIDDCSTDNTVRVIEELKRQDKDRITGVYLKRKMHGGGARNEGLKFATNSKYTLFLDSDDYYKSNLSVRHLYDIIVNKRFPDLVKCGYE